MNVIGELPAEDSNADRRGMGRGRAAASSQRGLMRWVGVFAGPPGPGVGVGESEDKEMLNTPRSLLRLIAARLGEDLHLAAVTLSQCLPVPEVCTQLSQMDGGGKKRE